jgi:hypothetical protein
MRGLIIDPRARRRDFLRRLWRRLQLGRNDRELGHGRRRLGEQLSARLSQTGRARSPRQARESRDNPSEEGIRTAGDEIRSATQTLADDLRGLGRPDTPSGQEAKDEIDQLATSLDTSLQKITDAMDNSSGTSGAVAAATTIGTTLVEMGNQVSSAFTQLEQVDAQGQLEDAFQQADSCAGLTTTS